ncbi:hypothetical protein E2C01_048055 [Portunus trituberculatus]|uniref:Uncharacterized protein n=1 Tax=Portunus trituberculatus TaxID=210409 RepID=A0A5B7GAI2_PORTR|nr:hypothetical protein [Portunus trituberculatus]
MHPESEVRKAFEMVTLLRRVRHLLDNMSIMTLYKAQVRLIMKYSPLAWMNSAQSHLCLVDKVQWRPWTAAETVKAASTAPTYPPRRSYSMEHRDFHSAAQGPSAANISRSLGGGANAR